MYKTVSTKLDDRNKAFWDALIKEGKKNIALTDLFCTDMSSINVASENNPYMDEENYKELKSKIKNINLRLMNADIYGYREEMKESFDLVNLSSIVVASSLIPPTFTAQKEFMQGFKLNKNGEVLTYIFDTEFDRAYEGWDKFPNEEDFKLYDLNDKDGVKEDAILVYKKVK